jgi:hypothetical protein
LARLSFESCPLAFDPAQLADYGQTHRFVADPEGRGNANTPGGGIYPEVEILYVLPYNFDWKT